MVINKAIGIKTVTGMYTNEIEANTIAKMEPMLTEKCAKLADDVERLVPPSGSFKYLFACFEDDTRTLDITSWAVSVRDLIFRGCNQKIRYRRYLELIGYPGGNSCISQIVGSGSVKGCVELLRSHDFIIKVMEKMKGILDKYAQI